MKKFPCILILCLVLFSAFSSAVEYDENGAVKLIGLLRGSVDYVHHEKQEIVINDRRYIMPLNFKVVTAAAKSSNRFAIRKGQSVEYSARYDSKTKAFYVDSLRLLN
ncbi:MAG: hypothetical protein OIF51_05935 [Cellvibrionaceae bacterium]|nr:hypothetical protein [Cellvibrionaceae bacterium]